MTCNNTNTTAFLLKTPCSFKKRSDSREQFFIEILVHGSLKMTGEHVPADFLKLKKIFPITKYHYKLMHTDVTNQSYHAM